MLVDDWTDRYRGVAPEVDIRYDPTGSMAGIESLRAGSVDFATSDVPLSDLEESLMGGVEAVAQVPWAAGAIAVAYNLPGVDGLKLSSATLAAIFSGAITRWDDDSVAVDNDGRSLPGLPITVVHRSDAAASTAVFTGYLDATHPELWGLGARRELAWPTGVGASGSEAVAAAVARTRGAIGYVQLGYARTESLQAALVENQAGRFVAPTLEAVTGALTAAPKDRYRPILRPSFRPEGPAAYPLSTVSYLLYDRRALSPSKADALSHFAAWALTEGQRSAEQLGYAPVPVRLASEALNVVLR